MFKKYFLFSTLLTAALLVAQLTVAQSPQYVQGQVLVQLHAGQDESDLPRTLLVEGQRLPVEFLEKVSDPMNIYLLSYPVSSGVGHENVLGATKAHRSVRLVQSNHFVETRSTIPDDPQFGSQWQYINTGQSGGTVDADIDIDEAWDITTGGLTATGDEIVVCIIDDGIDNDHPDIEPNLWLNEAEIPNNGIDDDNNGFVDDYRGWDTGSNSDAVYDGGGHGTPVAGIVGAKGNNGTGVSGVNWDVKLMIVQGGTGIESEVLEAYSYPLVMRQKFNETGGAEGAFVVSTNASWGIDFGQPADAPLWCAFYDTLGTYGVLNCGATINGNQNVDVIGDLPTACPSDYMIAVTNMNDDDEKVTGAGYGATTIDLGAHGQDAYTVQFGGGYGGFGGTSGATPHVAGTIGLLYSIPCQSLMSMAINDPEAAAAMVRDAVLDGVDPNASLQGITTTGGRLNVFNSMNLLLESCGPCPSPFGLEASATDQTATITWSESDSSLSANIEYRVVGGLDWILMEDVTSPHELNGLLACTEYEVRLQSFCSDENSDYTQPFSFTTDGCCENPSSFMLVDRTDITATYAWDEVLAATGYLIRFRPTGSAEWAEINVGAVTEFIINGLDECTEYEVQIQTLCAGDMIEYSDSDTFITLGCVGCSELDYCAIPEADASEEWISMVSVGSWMNTSEGGSHYEDFTESIPGPEVASGGSYPIELVPGYSGLEWDEYFKVYIDFNLDSEFVEDEVVFTSGVAGSGAVSGDISIPEGMSPLYTVMRVVMAYDTEPGECDLNSNFGQAEDYCVSVQAPLSVQDIGMFEFSLSPNPSDALVQLRLPLELTSSPAGIEIYDISGSLTKSIAIPSGSNMIAMDLSDLAPGMYQVRVTDTQGLWSVKPLIIR